MSNMYGYSDYNGPEFVLDCCVDDDNNNNNNNSASSPTAHRRATSDQDSDDLDDNPLQVGFWMEGDSLAPPCGSGIPTIHSLLEFAGVCADDIIYDLGCGDGRVCIEAFAKYNCAAIGVEVEADLVDRANLLISRLPITTNPSPRILKGDLRNVLDKLVRLSRQKVQFCGEEIVADGDSLPLPSVIVLYLLPDALREIQGDLISLLEQLPNGFRVVCNTWGIPNLKPIKTEEFREKSGALTAALLYSKQSLPTDR